LRELILTIEVYGAPTNSPCKAPSIHPLGNLVIISSRTDKDHAAQAINKTLKQDNTVFIPLDLSNLDNIRAYAKDLTSKDYPPIQALVLNAGLQFPGALQKTSAGLESTFAVNHVGHALLFHLLCPYLAPQARVVVTSSGTHDPAQKSGLPDAVYTTAEELAHPSPATASYSGRQRYASSKLANVMWTYALRRHLEKHAAERRITVAAMDPGLMPGTALAREASGFEQVLWMRVLPKVIPLLRLLISPNIHTPRESGEALARLAVGTDVEGVSGRYFEGKKEIPSSKDSYDEKKQEDLWDWTIEYLTKGDAEEVRRFSELH
jgi:NAD(P)-dependent dehydrogenase (short-subunit alcohol dehydrogenase family)